jgi:hypothetical protein
VTVISDKLALRKSLPEYLLELKQITGREIKSESLCSIENLEIIREASSTVLQGTSTKKFVIQFDEKNSNKFKDFIVSLGKANRNPVYVWTKRSNLHGLCKIDVINSIDFSFPFDINPDGIIVFLTEDLNDKLLLDFYRDSEEREMLGIELQGKHWTSVAGCLTEVGESP